MFLWKWHLSIYLKQLNKYLIIYTLYLFVVFYINYFVIYTYKEQQIIKFVLLQEVIL